MSKQEVILCESLEVSLGRPLKNARTSGLVHPDR